MGKIDQKEKISDTGNTTNDPRDDGENLLRIIEDLQGKIGAFRKMAKGGLFDHMRPRQSFRSRRSPGVEVTKFHREARCDDLEGLSDMISLIRRAGGQKKR
jgi:hypothetical protein